MGHYRHVIPMYPRFQVPLCAPFLNYLHRPLVHKDMFSTIVNFVVTQPQCGSHHHLVHIENHRHCIRGGDSIIKIQAILIKVKTRHNEA